MNGPRRGNHQPGHGALPGPATVRIGRQAVNSNGRLTAASGPHVRLSIVFARVSVVPSRSASDRPVASRMTAPLFGSKKCPLGVDRDRDLGTGATACKTTSARLTTQPPPNTRLFLPMRVHGRLELALRRYVRADFLVVDDFAVLAWTRSRPSSPSRSSPTATITGAPPASRPIARSRTGPRCSPTPSTPRSSPNGSPNAPSTSCSTERASARPRKTDQLRPHGKAFPPATPFLGARSRSPQVSDQTAAT